MVTTYDTGTTALTATVSELRLPYVLHSCDCFMALGFVAVSIQVLPEAI